MPGGSAVLRISLFFLRRTALPSLFSAAEDEGVQVQYDFGFDVALSGMVVEAGQWRTGVHAAVRSDSRDFDGVAEGRAVSAA